MTKSFMVSVFLISVLVVSSVSAFEKGENRISNGGFETDNVGETPNEWELNKGG